MHARAATAVPAAPETSLVLVTPAARARAEAALKRFEESIQALLDAPLNADLVGEWTAFRALNA